MNLDICSHIIVKFNCFHNFCFQFAKCMTGQCINWGLVFRESQSLLMIPPQKVSLSWTVYFGLVFHCKSTFWHMMYIKSKYRSALIEEHLDACLSLYVSNKAGRSHQNKNGKIFLPWICWKLRLYLFQNIPLWRWLFLQYYSYM